MNRLTILAVFFSILLFSNCGDNSTTNTVKSAGQNIFEQNCTSCHGSDGKLGVLGAKDLSISTMDKPQMIDIIKNGKSTMTPFGTMLNQEQLDAVADYVQTLRK